MRVIGTHFAPSGVQGVGAWKVHISASQSAITGSLRVAASICAAS
jgi:hypothetical protein